MTTKKGNGMDDLSDLVVEVETAQRMGDEPDLTPLDDLNPRELDALRGKLQALAQAVRTLDRYALEAMGHHLGEGRLIKFEDRVYRCKPDYKWRIREDRAAEFFHDIERTPGMARRLFNPNQARLGGLREFAAHDTELPDQVAWKEFEKEYLEVEYGAVRTSEMPLDRAPKWVALAPDGQIL